MAVNKEVVDALTRILGQARKGEIEGLAVAAIYSDDRYHAFSVGRAAEDTVLTIGILQLLIHDLSEQTLKSGS